MRKSAVRWGVGVVLSMLAVIAGGIGAANGPTPVTRIRPAQRAAELMSRMTIDEKIGLVTGAFGFHIGHIQPPADAAGGDGYVKGVSRLGIPDLQLVGAGLGVTDLGRRANGEATALPSSLAETASFDTDLAYEYGAVIGRETRERGFNVSLGGGINLTRDPRGGRAFEYHGEDPILAGRIVGQELKGVQDQGVVATIKHYAMNDLESDRHGLNVIVDERAMRETDLLAFEIALKESNAGAVLCAYNGVNGMYACENGHLLNDILKHDWGFKGWVMSDWGAVHSTVASANAGLDQEFYSGRFFGAALKKAIADGQVTSQRLDDMVVRILTSLISVGALDSRTEPPPTDAAADGRIALHVAEQGSVLLKNDGILPLDPHALHSIAVIGLHADRGVMSGGGSSQVNPIGGNAVPPKTMSSAIIGIAATPIWDPSPPLDSIRHLAPSCNVTFDDGSDVEAAVAAARRADVAVVFAGRRRIEGADVPDLALGDGQDELIVSVAAANSHTIVVLETGGAVLMPWLKSVGAVLEAWYPGQRGGEAIANILFGVVNPAGKLPLTFPAAEADLPRPALPALPTKAAESVGDSLHRPLIDVRYTEGLDVGYRWYDAQQERVLFPFGYGLSYTRFAYANLKTTPGTPPQVQFELTNTGAREGAEVAQVYVTSPPNTDEPVRLAGWAKVMLKPGERRMIRVNLEPRAVAIWDVGAKRWKIKSGVYHVRIGSSSHNIALRSEFVVHRERPLR